jgi:hypothetical protein
MLRSMSTAPTVPPPDLSDIPLWRLFVLLDDLEREQGATSPAARRVAAEVSERLGLATHFDIDQPGQKAVADAPR